MTKLELLQAMTEIFREYNEKYFDGKISKPAFGLFHKQRTLGTYFKKEHKIGLTDYYVDKMNRHDVEEIMVHEMVHAYLHDTDNVDTGAHHHHGPNFYAMANKINRMSNGYLHISRCTRLSCGTAPRKKRTRNTTNVLLIVGKTYDGNYSVGRIANDKIDYFMSGWLHKYYSEIQTFVATDGTKFTNFVTSQRRFNYHTFNKETFEKNVLPYIKQFQHLRVKRAA